MSNLEKKITNVNDLKYEQPLNSFYSITMKSKKLEWTLNIGNTDKDGHLGTESGKDPHYHLQILKKKRIYLKFNDCHIKFNDDDLFNLACLEEAGDIFNIDHGYHGGGPSTIDKIIEAGMIDELDENLKVSTKGEDSIVRRQTIIEAMPGNTISGDDIADAYEESEITKEPVGRILERKLSGVRVRTELSLADDIPEIKERSGRSRKKKE